MPKVKANCPIDGSILIQAEDMDLAITTCGPNMEAHYAFECPECQNEIINDADQAIINMLSPYVRVIREVIPAEMLEHPFDAPPINDDDLIDFMLALPDLVADFG